MDIKSRTSQRLKFSLRHLIMAMVIAASFCGWVVEWRRRAEIESRFAPLAEAMNRVAAGYGDNLRGYLESDMSGHSADGAFHCRVTVDFEVSSAGQRLIDSGASGGATSGDSFFQQDRVLPLSAPRRRWFRGPTGRV
jgi:hypothetical protein